MHERIIRALIASDPRMCRNGFARAVAELARDAELDAPELVTRDFRPDAYLIDHSRKQINVFEVEVTCALSEKKLFDYGWWWFCWDAENTDWEPRLFVVDRYGTGAELPLGDLYLSEVLGRHAPGQQEASFA